MFILYSWPIALDSVMTQMRIFMLDVFQITSLDCWQAHKLLETCYMYCRCPAILNVVLFVLLIQYVSFYTGYLFTVVSMVVFVLLSWAGHTFMGRILAWFPMYESSDKAFRNTIVKFTSLVLGVVYPGIFVASGGHFMK